MAPAVAPHEEIRYMKKPVTMFCLRRTPHLAADPDVLLEWALGIIAVVSGIVALVNSILNLIRDLNDPNFA